MSSSHDTAAAATDVASLRAAWLKAERRRIAGNAKLPVGEDGQLTPRARGQAQVSDVVMRNIGSSASRARAAHDVRVAGRELTPADRSALADLARSSLADTGRVQETFAAGVAFAMSLVSLDPRTEQAMMTLARADAHMVASVFADDYELFHAPMPRTINWPSEDVLRASAIRAPSPGIPPIPTTAALFPLSDRLEESVRVNTCAEESYDMLAALNATSQSAVFKDVRVSGLSVDAIVVSVTGVFLIWAIDYHWTERQASLVAPIRQQIQTEMGSAWPGHVEAMFHSPRELPTSVDRQLLIPELTGDPLDVVIVKGRIDEVIRDWQPMNGIGLDPAWIKNLCTRAQPRWDRSRAGFRADPEPPAHDQL